MPVEVKQMIEDCDSCPFGKAEKAYTADSWDDCRKIFCEKLKINVHSCLDWNEKSYIPKICPFKVGE